MFWIWLLIESLLFLLLTPLRILVTLVILFGWKPKFEFKEDLLEVNGDIEEKAIRYFSSFNILKYVKHGSGDSAKFAGMYVHAFPSEDGKKALLSYIKNGYFDRRVIGNHPKPFSGDMLAGWLLGISALYKAGLLKKEDIDKIERAVNKAFFEKPYCQFSAPWVKKKDRGFLFRYWFIGQDFLPSLALLRFIISVKPKLKYKLLYYWLRFLSFPWIDLTPEASIQRGNLFWISWYASHSKACLAKAVLNVEPNNKLFKKILTKVNKKHGWYNPDIRALYCDFFGWSEEDKRFVKAWLEDYTDEKHQESIPKEWRTNYIHLKSLIRYKFDTKRSSFVGSKYVLPTRFRRNEYRWEKTALNSQRSRNENIDYLHLYKLFTRKQD